MRKWKPQNFRLINREDSDEKGVCYEESRQTWVTLHRHISDEDLLNTTIEESVHQCLSMFGLDVISNFCFCDILLLFLISLIASETAT